MKRQFVVVNKGRKGKNRTPYVRFKSSDGEVLELKFLGKAEIAPFKVDQTYTLTLAPEPEEQTTFT